jgi:hypothetical protein
MFVKIVLSRNRRKRTFPKLPCSLATEKGERVSIDISSVNTNSFGKNRFWLLIQDEFTGYIWSEFITKKSQLPQVILHWIYKTQKEANVKNKTIRLDNSGENTALKKLIDRTDNSKIKFEFTAPCTTEPNGKISDPLWKDKVFTEFSQADRTFEEGTLGSMCRTHKSTRKCHCR